MIEWVMMMGDVWMCVKGDVGFGDLRRRLSRRDDGVAANAKVKVM